MVDIESLYKKVDGSILIEIKLSSVMQLFNSFDPAPFHEKELDTAAEHYIIETVKDLATRSHVLSLNASIEAVRAGEAGRGFAVVAAEVRALSEQSADAAAHIGKMVEASLEAIQSTLALTEASRQGMVGSLEEVRASGLRLGEIGAIVKETGDAAQEIARVVQQQSLGVGQIAGAMRELDGGMEETLERIQGLDRAAAHLQGTAARISQLVGCFRLDG